MVSATFLTILSVILVSITSLLGIITLYFREKKIEESLIILVNLSAGTLLGGAFFHLIPEVVEETGSFSVMTSILILLGISIFFTLDKVIHWKHSHSHSSVIHKSTHKSKKNKKSPSIIYLNLLGDGLHNFLDGLIIAGSYLISIPTGIATTIAVIIHEAPQEIADFGVLVYSGLSKKKALLFNFYSAAAAIVGGIIGLVIGNNSENFILWTMPFAAGAFIYIAGSNLIPEILKSNKLKSSIIQLSTFIIGIVIMYGLLFLE